MYELIGRCVIVSWLGDDKDTWKHFKVLAIDRDFIRLEGQDIGKLKYQSGAKWFNTAQILSIEAVD